MNVRFVLKTATSLLTILTFCILFVPLSFAKKGGGGKPPVEPPPPVEVSCANYDSAFPFFAYQKLKTGRKGAVSGTEIYLSNADGDCSILVYSSGSIDNRSDLSYRQNGNDGVIVWKQHTDETASRKDANRYQDIIKVVRFQTSNKEVTSSLPLSANTVAKSGDDTNGFRFIDLSHDGNTVLISYGDNTTTGGNGTINSIREMDISSCSSNCSLSAPLYSHTESGIHGLGYSPSGNRIYFASKYLNASAHALAGQTYVAFIEKQNGAWSVPRFVTSESNGAYSGDVSYFFQPDVAIADLGNGLTEVLAIEVYRAADQSHEVQVIDVGICSAAGSGDCVSSEDSFIEVNISDARFASFDNVSSANSLFFSSNSTDDIYEYTLGSGGSGLVTRAYGHQADAAN